MYQSIETLSDVLYVTQHARVVEHFRRVQERQWLLTRATGHDVLVIEGLGLSLPLDEIYAGVEPDDLPTAG